MRRIVTGVLVALLLLGMAPAGPARAVPRPGTPTSAHVERLLESLSPAERVAQLMLVTFEGSYVGENGPIVELIREYNIGGVVLLAENDNINGQVNTPQRVQTLTRDLQQLAYDAAEATATRETPRSFVPLFVATVHAGNGQPGTEIALGTTPLPSLMALGATWNPDLAQSVGEIAGGELSVMGINMLLGPPLDVHQPPQGERSLDLGVSSFGGEPHWVGKLAQAYIQGVHEGSQNRIAVIVQDFPGLGLADASPDEAIPVLPRTVDELAAFDLIPYYAVTGMAASSAARADGIQCTNARYQGATVRTITGPVCLDPQAADTLLDLDAFRHWRQSGLMVSSALGSPAIREYYHLEPFPHRQVAREAFLAGNDILYLDDFATEPGGDPLANVVDVIGFFAERYESDPVFRVRVDQSLTRILRVKLALYDGDLSPENVLQAPASLETIGTATAPIYAIAQSGTTLVAPRREALTAPPSREDDIVIFTDVRMQRQCSYCATYPAVPVNALEATIERMYGPRADSQVDSEQVVSFSYSQLQAYLSGGPAGLPDQSSAFRISQQIGEALRGADWVVFVMMDMAAQVEASSVILDFLHDEPSAERAKLAVIALGSPIYLSSTEISKLAAYFALYSHVPPYIDAAARALFQESSTMGALPISLPAVGYDLFHATAPDPAQAIPVQLESVGNRPTTNASPREVITGSVGDKLTFRAGPILDHNGHPVPDETVVEFTLTFTLDNLQTRQSAPTVDGVATTSFTPNRAGRVQVTAASGGASGAAAAQIVIASEGAVAQGAPSGTADIPSTPPLPAAQSDPRTPEQRATQHAAETAEPGSVGAAEDAPERAGATPDDDLEASDLVVALFGLALMGAVGFGAGLSTTLSVNGGLRVVLGSVVAGLAGYLYYGVDGPGSAAIRAALNELAPTITTLGAGLVGLVAAWWSVRGVRRQA